MNESRSNPADFRFSILLMLLMWLVCTLVATIQINQRLGIPSDVAAMLAGQGMALAWTLVFLACRQISVREFFGPRPATAGLVRWCAISALWTLSLWAMLLLLATSVIDVASLPEEHSVIDKHPLAFALSAILLAPFAEDFLCRGLVLRNCLQRMRPALAVMVSAAVFAAMHLQLMCIGQFCFGILTAVAFLQTRSLWVPIVMHVLNNALLLPTLSPGFDQRLSPLIEHAHLTPWIALPLIFAIALAWGVALLRMVRGLGGEAPTKAMLTLQPA